MSIYAQFLLQHRASEALYISMYALVYIKTCTSTYVRMYMLRILTVQSSEPVLRKLPSNGEKSKSVTKPACPQMVGKDLFLP